MLRLKAMRGRWQLNCIPSSQDNQIGYAESFNNLGIVLKELGQLQTSINSYEKILAIKPDFAEAHFNLGLTYQELDQRDAAVKSYRKALAIKPDYADAFTNLGFILQEIGQPDEVAKCFEQALAIKPDYAEAHNNLGNALSNLGQLDDASKCFEQALAINPDYAEAHNNLGLSLQDLGQLDAALKSYEKAIAIKPDFADAHRNLGGVLLDLKRLDEAMTSFERALVLNPKLNFLLGHLLHTKMHLSLWDGLSSMLDELQNKINNNEKVTDPFALLGLIDNPELQRKNTEAFANKFYPQSYNLPSIGVYPRHKKIRIGYFSGDFHDHATMHLMAELFECHDKSLFELIAFSFGPDKKDQWRQRALLCFDKFENVGLKSDREIALLARKMEVDIAIDLKGYTKNSRPKMFAEGCAPIQLSYLGYPGTIAAKYIDYLIADRTLIPEEKKHHYLEKIVYMPNSYQVNMSNREVSKNALIRDELGLPVKGFVFCCFNNAYKITPSTFAGWMRILSAVENSILWLLEGNATHNKNLKNEAIQLGVNEDRIIFAKFMPVEDHLNRIKEADLFIDTLPCNAHTTASDALRMGLPVLTYVWAALLPVELQQAS